jgi:hypothetical protein
MDGRVRVNRRVEVVNGGFAVDCVRLVTRGGVQVADELTMELGFVAAVQVRLPKSERRGRGLGSFGRRVDLSGRVEDAAASTRPLAADPAGRAGRASRISADAGESVSEAARRHR